MNIEVVFLFKPVLTNTGLSKQIWPFLSCIGLAVLTEELFWITIYI